MYRTWNSGTWNTGTWNEVVPENSNNRKERKGMQAVTRTFRLLDPAVIQLGNNIITGATGKAELANSPVTVAQLQTLVDEGTTALNEEAVANGIAAMKRTERIEKMEALRVAINRFAAHADAIYAGDKASLQAVGLEVRQPATPIGPLPAPGNLRSTPGALEGTIDLDWDPSPSGRPQYFAECASSANGPWTQVYTGRASRATCGELTPGAEYFFRVKAHGTAGDSPWSDITKRRAS
jgi:hypothetical protein